MSQKIKLTRIVIDIKTSIKTPYSTEKCPDSLYGYMGYINEEWEWISTRKENQNDDTDHVILLSDNNIKSIVMILESPHKNEYDSNNLPIRIMNGEYIIKNFEKSVLNNFNNSNSDITSLLNKKVVYRIYVVNAIQYQCSLAVSTNFYRDLLFLNYWSQSFYRNDLIKRIDKIHDLVLVINLCTNGDHSKIPDHILKKHGIKNIAKGFNKKFLNELGISKELYKNNSYTLKKMVGQELYKKIKKPILNGPHPSSIHSMKHLYKY